MRLFRPSPRAKSTALHVTERVTEVVGVITLGAFVFLSLLSLQGVRRYVRIHTM